MYYLGHHAPASAAEVAAEFGMIDRVAVGRLRELADVPYIEKEGDGWVVLPRWLETARLPITDTSERWPTNVRRPKAAAEIQRRRRG